MKGKVFLFLVLVYVVLFLLKKTEFHFYFISSYVADAIALPIVLTGMEYLIRRTIRSDFETRWLHLLVVGLVFSVWFEVLRPRWDQRFTGDYWDVLMYFFGGIIWMLLFPPSQKRNRN